MSQIKSLRTGIKFKDTPLGKIPVDWEAGPFSAIAAINPKRNLKNGSIYPFVEMAAVSSESHRVKYSTPRKFVGGGSKFQNEDTIFARITPCTENGKTAYIDFLKDNEVGHGSTEFIVLGPKENVAAKFIYYCAKWDKVRSIAISKMEGTSGRQRVPSKVFLEDIFVGIPPLPEQTKIAEILTTVDDAIEETDRIIEKTKELKKGLMQKLLTRGIGHKKFKKTEIGEMPEEWEVIKLDKVVKEFYNGGTPDTKVKEYWDGNIPWVTGADFLNQRIGQARRYITMDGVKNSATNVIPKGNLLVVTRTGVGKLAIAPFDIAISQDITGVITDAKRLLPEFLYRFLDYHEKKLKSLVQGTSINGLLREDLASLNICLPPLKEQNKITDILFNIDLEIENEKAIKQTLKTLKKSLMQVLLTGRVRVKLR